MERNRYFPRSSCAPRSRSWLLLVALLPTLTFLGHWPALTLAVPGTESVLAIPLFGHDGNSFAPASGEDDEHEHEQHCHANAASCTDVPYTGASAFALMALAVATLALAASHIRMYAALRQIPAGLALPPELQPPRAVA